MYSKNKGHEYFSFDSLIGIQYSFHLVLIDIIHLEQGVGGGFA